MTTKRCAFLTMENTAGWFIDADLAIPPMQALGWTIDTVPWRGGETDWRRYDAVYIGTPWDYPEDVEGFMRLLEQIDASGPVLINPLELVRWGLAKTYLRDLEAKGAEIVPSAWYERLPTGELLSFFDTLGSDRIVIKPVVSTNATDTFLLERQGASRLEPLLQRRFGNRAFVAQPFVRNVQVEGEFSLFYFGGVYSHAIQKVPRAQDFRVQEEHGASILAIEPEPALAACAHRILQLVDPLPVYARCDLLRGPDGRFLLMELELIEPSMYLRTNADAPQRFAQAFDDYVKASNSTR
jgi:hypothetical protein